MNYSPAVSAFGDAASNPIRTWPTLSNQLRFSSDDYAETRRFITSSTTDLYDFSVDEARRFVGFRSNAAYLGNIRIGFVKVDCPHGYQIGMRQREDLLVLQILLRGTMQIAQGHDEMSVHAGQLIMVDPLQPTRKLWRGSSEQIMINFERSRLEHVLASEAGIAVNTPLSFASCDVAELRQMATLWHYIQMVCHDLDGPASSLGSGHAARVAERMLGLLVLKALPNNYGPALGGETTSRVAPYYVRRVEEYVRLHAARDISVDELVAISGASSRSLYHGFRTYRATTPMGYVKSVRLNLARAALLKGRESGVTVTAAALGAGYSNLSQFSRDYRTRFRESPSQTLTRA